MKRYIVMFVFCLVLVMFCDVRAENVLHVQTINHQQLISKIARAGGKVVVLNFWASWCPPCRMEIPGLMQIRKKYSENDVLILGVSVDDNVNMLKMFLYKNKINYPIYWATSDISLVFGVRNLPRLIVYNQDGEKAYDHEGYLPPEQLKTILDRLLSK